MINLIEKRNYFFMISILIILAGIAGYVINGGFNLDIQFQGGTIIEVQMPNDKFDEKKIEDTIKSTINKKVIAQKSKTYNSTDRSKAINLLIINVASKDTLKGEEHNKVFEVLRTQFGVKTDAQSTVRNIHPSIGKELLTNGLWAVFTASLLIILYIWIRFKIMSGLAAGVTAVLGLLHDCLVMIAVYTIFNIPLNESFIAAILTILGYSMNDTIIIYDRIRENNSLLRKTPISELVNTSILQTLARSINTVVTVLIAITTVYVFAYYNNISSIKEFSFPLIIGIASGAYSSIFIASPLWVMWKEYQLNKKKVAA